MAANDLMLLIYRSEEQNRTARPGSGDIPEHLAQASAATPGIVTARGCRAAGRWRERGQGRPRCAEVLRSLRLAARAPAGLPTSRLRGRPRPARPTSLR
jgi:hypothetical protein